MLVAPVTTVLLLINVLISVYALYIDRSLFDRWAFQPVRVLQNKEWHRMLTGGFLHGSIAHLLFNMLTLFFFGPYLELRLGSPKFVALYFGAELAAHVFTLVRHREDPTYAAVGASGAIAGVVFAFCLFEPLQKIYLMFIPIGIPAVLFAVLFVVFSTYAMRGSGEAGPMGRIAHDAHLGGAIGGLLLTVALEPSVVQVFLGHF